MRNHLSGLREANFFEEVCDLFLVALAAVHGINFDVNVVVDINAAVDLCIFIEVFVVTEEADRRTALDLAVENYGTACLCGA